MNVLENRDSRRALGVLLGSVVGLTLGYSTFVVVAFGLFVRPLSQAFGWSRTDISFALTVSSFIVVICGPVLGRHIDKVGARRVLLPSIALFGIAVGCFSLLSASLWHFYFMFFIMALVGLGTLPCVYTRFIVDWFTRRRGIALGATLSGVGIGLILGPPFIQQAIDGIGWRGGYLLMAGLILGVSLPAAFALLHDRSAIEPAGIDANETANSHVLGGLLRDRIFLTLLAAFCLLGAISVGLTAHLPSFFMDNGYSGEDAAAFMSVFGAAVIVGRLGCGVLIDRFHAPLVMSVFLCGMVVALLMLSSLSGGNVYVVAVVLLGMGFGAELDVMSYLVSRYFSFDRYSGVYAYVYSAFTAGAALGPVLMGACYDGLGNYLLGFLLLAALGLVSVGMILTLGPYRQTLVCGEAVNELA